MAGVEKLSVALTPELAASVRAAVRTGEYASTSEVVREALRAWRLRRTGGQRANDELRRLWDEGLASGPGRFGSIEDIKAEGRRRLARVRSKR